MMTTYSGTFPSRITIDTGFAMALLSTRIHPSILVAQDINHADALIRTRLRLAIVMAHEFCHALWSATTTQNQATAFYREYRISEIGSTFESIVFNGQMSGMPYWPGEGLQRGLRESFPHGLILERWPGAYRGPILENMQLPPQSQRDDNTQSIEPIRAELCSNDEAEVYYTTCYLVHMRHIYKFFTEDLYNNQSLRFGLYAYHPPREYGYRLLLTGHAYLDGTAPRELSPKPPRDSLP